MLPLDEEPFEIDANKRTIAIPSHFRSNGVSVVGDEIAETVFFKIARFFDAMDLNTCDIFVQWSDINGDEYATPINLIDIESEPGYIIFAWPISSAMTKHAGTIKFSARFLKQDDATGKIVYSFSTLTADIKINSALNFNISNTTKDDVSDLFAAAIENSQSATGIPAATPVFHINLSDSDNNSLTPELAYLIPQEDGSRALTLTVYADVFDTGVVRYEWYKRVGDTIGSKIQNPNVATILVKTEDLIPAQDKTYYTEAGDLYDVTEGFNPEVQAYEKHNQLTISGTEIVEEGSEGSVIGDYYVKAINRYGNREAEAVSNVITLPGPTTPVITKDLETGVIEKPEDGYTLVLEAATAAHSIDTYSWKKSDSAEGTFTAIEGASGHEYTAASPGFYQAVITSEVNLATKDANSSIVRVTALPEAIEFAETYRANDAVIYKNINRGETEINLGAFVTAPEVSPLTADSVEYHWYIDADGEGVIKNGEIVDSAVEITYDSSIPYIKGLEAFSKDTNMRCVAINTLNGRKALTESVLFIIDTPAVE